MPGNDFLDYMWAPPQTQWGVPSGYGGGSFNPNRYWGGMQPGLQQFSWNQLGQQYAGNVGGMLGGVADSYAPLERFGIWSMNRDMGINRLGQHSYNLQTANVLMQNAQGAMQARVLAALQAQGVKGNTLQLEGAAGMLSQSGLVQSIMGGGQLSDTGSLAMVGVAAGMHNGYRPSTSEVAAVQQGFNAYYGFNAGGAVNYGRTMGRTQDELAVLTSEVRRRTDPGTLDRARTDAARELQSFRGEHIGKELGIGADRWRGITQGAEDDETIVRRLAATEGMKEDDARVKYEGAMNKVAGTRYGLNAVNLETLTQRNLMEQNTPAMRAYSSFQAAGFTGSIEKFFGKMEEDLGNEALNPQKLEAFAERLRGIADATGMTLESISGLVQTIQKSSGGMNLGVVQAGAIAGIASNFDTRGLTRQQQAVVSGSIAQTFAESNQSPNAIIMGMMNPADAARIQKLYDEGKPVAAQAALGAAVNAGAGGAWTSLQYGDFATAGKIVQGLRENLVSDITRYNAMPAGADRERMLSGLQARGAVAGQNGQLSAPDPTAIHAKNSATESWGFAKTYGLSGQIEDLGMAMLGAGATSEDRRAAASAYAWNLAQPNATMQSALTMTQKTLKKAGIEIGNVNIDSLTGAADIVSRANLLGGTDWLRNIGIGTKAEAMSAEAAKDAEKNQRMGRLKDFGKAGDAIRRAAEGTDTSGGKQALLDAFSASEVAPWKSAIGQILDSAGGDTKKRGELFQTLSEFTDSYSTIATAPAGDPRYASTIAEARKKQSAAQLKLSNAGIDVSTLLGTADKGGLESAISAMNAAGLGTAAKDFLKIQGELAVTIIEADGTRKKGSGNLDTQATQVSSGNK